MSVGTKELVEAVRGVNELTILVATRLRDGLQLADFEAVWLKLQTDPEFKKVLQDAYDGYKLIPEEINDLDLAEGIGLATVQVSYVPRLVEAFKKPLVNPVAGG